jgi:hypothetical protein
MHHPTAGDGEDRPPNDHETEVEGDNDDTPD